jgi:hypothetical protein
MNFDLRKDVRGKFMAKDETLLSMANIKAVNEKGQSSVDIDRVDQQVVNTERLNFVFRADNHQLVVLRLFLEQNRDLIRLQLL